LYDRSAAAGWAPSRYRPGGRTHDDSAARNRRRSRLRVTAGPLARPIANATRGGDSVGSTTYVHHRTPARTRWPSTRSRSKERRSRTRQITPRGGDGPCHDGTSAPPGRRGCSSARGSRASSPGGGCSVGTCASRSLLALRLAAKLLVQDVAATTGNRRQSPITPGYVGPGALPTNDRGARAPSDDW